MTINYLILYKIMRNDIKRRSTTVYLKSYFYSYIKRYIDLFSIYLKPEYFYIIISTIIPKIQGGLHESRENHTISITFIILLHSLLLNNMSSFKHLTSISFISKNKQKLNQKIGCNLGSDISATISSWIRYCGAVFLKMINALKLYISLHFSFKMQYQQQYRYCD